MCIVLAQTNAYKNNINTRDRDMLLAKSQKLADGVIKVQRTDGVKSLSQSYNYIPDTSSIIHIYRM